MPEKPYLFHCKSNNELQLEVNSSIAVYIYCFTSLEKYTE